MANGVELATAYVSLVPSTRGIADQVKREVGGPLERVSSRAGTRGGQSFGRNLASNAVAGIDRMGSSIVDSVQRWAGRAAVVGSAILGAGLFGGLKRVLDTEDATVAFRQMGLSVTEIEKAMKGVDRTFDGTPFANPQGFNIAAQLLASGRGLGQIETDLRNISNVTAQTLDKDLNRTSQTFLRIAATGRAYATDLNMLALQGIPIRNILADGLNVSADALADMVSDGEITFDVLMDIIGATERFDGAAQAMGNTTRGAFQNVLTGISRLGESFLSPLFGENGYAVTALQSIRTALRNLTPAADELGRRFAAWLIPAVQSAAEWFSGTLVPTVKGAIGFFAENREAIIKIAQAAIPAAAAIAGLATAFTLVKRAMALTPIGLVLTLATALVYAWQNSETFRRIVTDVFNTIRSKVAPVLSAVVDWFRNLGSRSSETGEQLSGLWSQVSGTVSSALDAIRAVVERVVTTVQNLWERFGSHLLQHIKTAWNAIVQTFSGALSVVQGILDVITGIFTGDWKRVWGGVVQIFAGAWNAILGIIKGAINYVSTIIGAGMAIISAAWSAGWNAVKTFFSTVWGYIARFMGATLETIARVLDGAVQRFKSAIGSAWKWVSDRTADAWNWVSQKISSFLTWLGSVPGTIRSKVGDAFGFLRQQATDVKNWISDRIEDIVGFFTGLPGRISSAAGNMFSFLGDGLKSVLQRIANLWNNFRFPSWTMPSVSIPGIGTVGGATIGGWSLPHISVPNFHTGGVVPGRRGEEVLVLALAGETVLPTHDPTWSPQTSDLGLRRDGAGVDSIDYQALGSAVAAALRAEPPVTVVADVAAGLRRYDRSLR